MFKLGDRIVYPLHGAGEIVAIEEKEILGETKEYYIMEIPIGEMRVMVPVDSVEESGVRDILTREEMDDVIETLKESRSSMPKNWNHRYRANMDKIKSGDIIEIAEVVRNLELLDAEKSLSTGERKMLSNAKQIIVSEILLVYDLTEQEAEELVEEAIQFNEEEDEEEE